MKRYFMIPMLLVLVLCSYSVPAAADAADEKIRISCVGDSITFGAGVKDREKNCYPVVMNKLLGDKYEVKNFGVNAATLLNKGDKPYTKLKAYKDALALNPNIVIIKLGTNDSKPHNWTQHSGEFEKDYIALIDSFKALKTKPRIIICIAAPVVGKGNWGINEPVMRKEILPMLQNIAKKTGAELVDLHTPLADKPKLIPDRVHPNVEGAKIIAETLAAAIKGKK